MSSDTTDQPARRVYRTVTPPYRGRSDEEMNLVGYLLIAGLLILLIPLGPVLLLLWLLALVRRDLRRRDVV
ncbi:DUF7535 family protein [Salinibaculum salinum]|uniref:DUF7535 family protein n=1 Tax=Salinibaculum salinum TaxID=3131996 RepID=UPI0030ECB6E0